MEQRIQKLIAAAGIASRRAAEKLILEGLVTVDGTLVTELGAKADPELQHVKVRGKLINPGLAGKHKVYLLLNKPRGYLSSTSDPLRRPLVLDLIPAEWRRGLHVVGRLDFNSEGLLLLTNDGEFTDLLTRAGKVPKVYEVKVRSTPAPEEIDRLRRGIRLGKDLTAPAQIRLIKRTREGDNAWYEVTLREGKNNQIRRMFESIGHPVAKLRRVRIGHLTAQGLEPGGHRALKPGEVSRFLASHGALAPRKRGRPGQGHSPSRANSQVRSQKAGKK